MGKRLVIMTATVGLAFSAGTFVRGPALSAEEPSVDSSKLAVVWTSGDRDVALKMVFMYTLNAKKQGWFDQVQLIVWGPSSKLLTEDEELQASIAAMKDVGVELTACKACADSYGVSDKLEALGIEVKYMGVPLTEMLRSDWIVTTF